MRQFFQTLTQRSRKTRAPSRDSISSRASTPMALSRLALFADDDGLLGFPLHVDYRPNPHQLRAPALIELLHRHRHRVRQLFPGVVQDPLPDKLRGQETLAGLGILVRGVKRRAGRQQLGDFGLQLLQAVSQQGAEGNDDGRGEGLVKNLDEG